MIARVLLALHLLFAPATSKSAPKPPPVTKPAPKPPAKPAPIAKPPAKPPAAAPKPAAKTPPPAPAPAPAPPPAPATSDLDVDVDLELDPDPIPDPAPEPPSAPAPARPRVVVDLPAADWFSESLEQTLTTELLRFSRIDVAEKLDAKRCPDRNPRCLVDHHRASGVDVVVLGQVEEGVLRYEVFETWTGARSFDGTLAVSGVTSSELRRRMGALVRPIVAHGGLLDDRPESASEPPRVAHAVAPQGSNFLLLLLAAAIFLVSSPILLALVLCGRELGGRTRPASWKWSAILLVALSTLPVVVGIVDVPALLARFAQPPSSAIDLLPPVVGGMLWGTLLLLVGAWLFAPIHGMQHIRHDALWPLLRSWSTLTILRSVALSFCYAPILLLTWRACGDVGLPPNVTLAFVVPAAGLLVHFCLLSLVDNLSAYLDLRLVTGLATTRNPWHATIKRYFRGYLRRNGIQVADAVLERVLFLPSARDDVVAYGGGFARPRILVGARPRETALGELPDEEEFPDRTVNMEELPAGFLVPSMRERDDLAQHARAEERRRKLTLAPPRPRQPMPRLVGEHATLLGWVMPQSREEGLPLISDTEDDYGVVKRLLTEHYAAFEGNIDGEVDDTDPTQKDFLFGAVLREVGVIARRDSLFSTLRLAVEVASQRVPPSYRFFVRPLLAAYDRFLGWPAARIGDAYAALNGAFHHLIQHLCLARGADPSLLTARANEPQLVKTSHEMLSGPEADDGRVVWLARYFYAALAPPRRVRWLRVVGTLALAAAATALVVSSVRDAVSYHPKYVERMSKGGTGR